MSKTYNSDYEQTIMELRKQNEKLVSDVLDFIFSLYDIRVIVTDTKIMELLIPIRDKSALVLGGGHQVGKSLGHNQITPDSAGVIALDLKDRRHWCIPDKYFEGLVSESGVPMQKEAQDE